MNSLSVVQLSTNGALSKEYAQGMEYGSSLGDFYHGAASSSREKLPSVTTSTST